MSNVVVLRLVVVGVLFLSLAMFKVRLVGRFIVQIALIGGFVLLTAKHYIAIRDTDSTVSEVRLCSETWLFS